MPTLADTAYPRLRVSPDGAELSDAFTPTPDELAFAVKRTRQPGPRLALLVMLKTFQRLGHFAQPDDVPPIIVAHIAAASALPPTARPRARQRRLRRSRSRAAATTWPTSSMPRSRSWREGALNCPRSARS